VIFVGMGTTVLRVVQGEPAEPGFRPAFPDAVLTAGPPLALLVAVLGLGLWVPARLLDLFRGAAALVGG
jgi:hypothetical protein